MRTRTFLALLAQALIGLLPVQAAPTAGKDFNGDGKADVLWRNTSTGENYLYLMSGREILPAEGYLRAVADLRWSIAGVGDIDGNGTADILWRHSVTGENYVYFMSGTGIVAEGYLRTVADTAWKVAGIGDFNNDGRDDILWRNASTGENYVYLMDGLAITGEGYLRTVSNLAWKVAGIGDTNGDGSADIVWRNASTGENYVYLMNGLSIENEGYLRTVADANWRIAAVADFDGDGKADIFWRHSVTGENYLYPLDGTAILGGEGYVRTVADLNWRVAMAGDFDQDGTADILWRNAITGENYVYFMAGTTILPAEGFTRAVADASWQVRTHSAASSEPPWGASTRISTLRNQMFYQMYTPSLALTSQNVGFVAWNEATGPCGRTWVARNAGGTWGSATEVGSVQAISPYVAANASGDAIVVWTEREFSAASCGGAITGAEIWVNRYSAASNNWSGASRLSVDAPPDSTIYAETPVATLDDAGRATVLWVQDTAPTDVRTVWYSRLDGTWSAPAMLSNGTRHSEELTARLDGSGNVFAVWRQDTNAGSPSNATMWAARFDAAAGAWSTPARIGSELTGFDGSERPRLAVNARGDAVVIWEEGSGGIHSIMGTRFSPTSLTWSTPVPLEANAQQAYWPAVAIDAGGNAQAVWIQRIDGSEAVESGYTARLNAATGAWSAPELFEQTANAVSFPQVGMDAAGRAVIAWNQFVSGQASVHAVHYTPASGFSAQAHFPGLGLAIAVNALGTALLASDVPNSFEGSFFGVSIRAEVSRP